jgi:ubiquinone/menaquinone biosynthesis C-methylase UbiE
LKLASIARSKLQEIETVLRTHPGVRDVAVILWEDEATGEERLTGYVVPDNDYVDRAFSGVEDETKRVKKWRKLYDLTHLSKDANSSQPGFDIDGWNSSYTRSPIPAEEMREWVENTVSEIISLHPSQVLEIGCGTGLLLLRIAPCCQRYVALDFSPVVLQTIRRQMEALGGDWSVVTLLERAADNFDGVAKNSFDTVIINSAAQYFPNLAYLTRVLENAIRVVKPGGQIFLGDLRNLALLELYAISIELYQASESLSVGELRQRVRHRIRFQEELVISPAFFLALHRQIPKISRVEIRPKRGRFNNEMTRFRYDAILSLGAPPEKILEPRWQDWQEKKGTVELLAGQLKEQRPDILALKRISNVRVMNDFNAFAKLASPEASATVGMLRELLEKSDAQGIDPSELWTLGEKLGYHVDLSWAASRPDGSYDAVFRRETDSKSAQQAIEWAQPPAISGDLSQYTNSPGRAVLYQKLIDQLRQFSRERLPENLVPAAIIAMDELPLATDGSLKLSTLPPPSALSQ